MFTSEANVFVIGESYTYVNPVGTRRTIEQKRRVGRIEFEVHGCMFDPKIEKCKKSLNSISVETTLLDYQIK